MNYKHFIITGSSYKQGTRIGLHTTSAKDMENFINLYKAKNSKLPISFHTIDTRDKSFESVVIKDAFFKGIKIIPEFEQFFNLLEENEEISGLDVAYYILSQIPCCHTKLEKLVYYTYADYLQQTNKPLFRDTIFAFSYGPVIESVYNKFKRKYDLESTDNIVETYNKTPIKSRILASDDGVNKLYSIDKTLQKYGNFTASQLVKLTHNKNTPWSKTEIGEYKTISNEDILKYHKFETI